MVNISVPGSGDPDPVLPPLCIGALVAGTIDIMMEASDLPQPRYVGVSDTQQLVSLQFESAQPSATALAAWMFRFGGLLTRDPEIGEDGTLSTLLRLTFGYYGLRVVAYAFIPA
jgi:hypothetical protein